MRSEAWARSIVLVATAGCQRSWPLKSRSTFQTAPVGAPRMVLLTICGTLASKGPFQRVKPALEHAAADVVDELGFAFGRAVELGRPFGKGLVAVGDRGQAKRGDVVLHPHWGLQDGVGAEHVVIGQSQ